MNTIEKEDTAGYTAYDFSTLEDVDEDFDSFKPDAETTELVKILHDENASKKDKLMAKDRILQKNMKQINQYVNFLISHICSYTRPDIRDDALQEACLQFLEMLDSYDPEKCPTPYLYAYKAIQRVVCKTPSTLDYGYTDHTIQTINKVHQLRKNADEDTENITPEYIASQTGWKMSTANHYLSLAMGGNQVYISDITDDNRGLVASSNDKKALIHDDVIYNETHSEVMKRLSELLPPVNKYILVHLLGINCKKMTSEELYTTMQKRHLYLEPKEIQYKMKKSLAILRDDKQFMDLISR